MEPGQTQSNQPEQAPKSNPEVAKPAVDAGSAAPAAPTPAASSQSDSTPKLTIPEPPKSAPTPAANAPKSATATPAGADDVDVIEKEWVDAAEAVIDKTAGDPHAEEEGFEDLQVDYLKKRYGKDIKKPSE